MCVIVERQVVRMNGFSVTQMSSSEHIWAIYGFKKAEEHIRVLDSIFVLLELKKYHSLSGLAL